MKTNNPLLGLLLVSALAEAARAEQRKPRPEMPATLPEGVDLTDAFRLLRHPDGAQALIHRTDVNGAPSIEVSLEKAGMPPLKLALSYENARTRDIDFFRFDTDMVGGVLDQALGALGDVPCTCGMCG